MKKKMTKTAGHYFTEIKETNKQKNNSEFNTKRVWSLRSTTTGGFISRRGEVARAVGKLGNWLACAHYFPVNFKFESIILNTFTCASASDQSRVREKVSRCSTFDVFIDAHRQLWQLINLRRGKRGLSNHAEESCNFLARKLTFPVPLLTRFYFKII